VLVGAALLADAASAELLAMAGKLRMATARMWRVFDFWSC
jgi:hypothetical protein